MAHIISRIPLQEMDEGVVRNTMDIVQTQAYHSLKQQNIIHIDNGITLQTLILRRLSNGDLPVFK